MGSPSDGADVITIRDFARNPGTAGMLTNRSPKT
jgi:hypothetical protein